MTANRTSGGTAERRRLDPFGLLALAAAGTLAAHQVGYLFDQNVPGDGVSHTYLSVVGPSLTLLLCVLGWFSAVRILRRDPGRLPSLPQLASVQVALFAAMEVAEHVTAGATDSLASTPVLIGLVLQPIVAWAALRLLTAGRFIIERMFLRETIETRDGDATIGLPWTWQVLGSQLQTTLHLRGPPSV